MRGMLCGVQISEQFRADALEGLLQQIEAIAEGLITRKVRKPVSPIIYNQIVDLLFRKFSVEMTENQMQTSSWSENRGLELLLAR